MPGRKKLKKNDDEVIENNDTSLIVHLPIKVESSETMENNNEIEKLKKENKLLKEKLAYYLNKVSNRVNIIKNKPKKDSCKCWWCCGSNATLTLPEKKYGDQFIGRGKFCSISCMVSYNFDLADDKVWERYSLIHQLKDKINPKLEKIRPAPPKEVKKDFGGELSEEEYEEYLDNGDDSFIKLIPPLISTEIIIEHRSVHKNPELSQLLVEETKLKRSKPISTSHYSLDYLIKKH